jgi:hypothetical protein
VLVDELDCSDAPLLREVFPSPVTAADQVGPARDWESPYSLPVRTLDSCHPQNLRIPPLTDRDEVFVFLRDDTAFWIRGTHFALWIFAAINVFRILEDMPFRSS